MSDTFITLDKNSIITLLFTFNDKKCHYSCFVSGKPIPLKYSYFKTTKDLNLVYVDPLNTSFRDCKNGEIFSNNLRSVDECNRRLIIDMLDSKNESGPPDGYINTKDYSFVIFGSSNFIPVSYSEAYRLYQ